MNNKKRKNLIFNEAISMNKFLQLFYNTYGIDFSCLTHQELSILMPHVKRTPFEYALKNIEMISDGTLIIVKDKLGNPVLYINPKKDYNNNYDEIEVIDSELFFIPTVKNDSYIKNEKTKVYTHRYNAVKKDPKPKEKRLKYSIYDEFEID